MDATSYLLSVSAKTKFGHNNFATVFVLSMSSPKNNKEHKLAIILYRVFNEVEHNGSYYPEWTQIAYVPL